MAAAAAGFGLCRASPPSFALAALLATTSWPRNGHWQLSLLEQPGGSVGRLGLCSASQDLFTHRSLYKPHVDRPQGIGPFCEEKDP